MSSTTSSTPTYIDLGITCTPLAEMPDYTECHASYVTATAASTTKTVLAARSLIPTGLSSNFTGKDGHTNYVLIGLIIAVAVLGLVLGMLTYCMCVRHHKRKKGGK